MSEFELDAGTDRYESTVEIDGEPVWVRVSSPAFDDKARIEEVVAVVTRENDRLLDAVVDGLLEDKNDSWLEDDEDPLTEAEFRRKIKIAAINIGPDGELELLLYDSGMFWGHVLTVRLDSEFQIVRVNLEG
jgi:hypothetical protein